VSLVLCRHAATNPNLAFRFLSTTDEPLGERGVEQCERLREALRAFTFAECLVSPMQRCLQTRELVAPDVPFAIEPALREVNFGQWEGKTLDELEAQSPHVVVQRRNDPLRFRPPGGETIEEAGARMRPLAERLRRSRDILVIGHRVTLGTLERLLRDLPLDSQEVAGLQPAEFRVVRE
jgi:alpha-ribazole phosphatase